MAYEETRFKMFVMRRAQTEPVVAVVLAPHQFRFGFAELLLMNEGTGPATDVKFVVEPVGAAEPELLEKVQNLGFIKRGVRYMSPRQEIRTFLASMIERSEQRMNTNIRVRVSYRTPLGDHRSGEFELDFSPFWGYSELGKHPLVAIEKELEKIQNQIASVVSGFRKVPVRTYTLEEEARANHVSLLHLKLSSLDAESFRQVEELIDSRYHGPLLPASDDESYAATSAVEPTSGQRLIRLLSRVGRSGSPGDGPLDGEDMNHLARAVVGASAFLEFAERDTLNPDDAVRALENIAHTLHGASPEEIEAISEACAAERESYAQLGANSEVLQFFDRFLYNVGLIEEPPDSSAQS